MIINKSSLERGFKHGTLIKTETIDLTARKGQRVRLPVGVVRLCPSLINFAASVRPWSSQFS